MSEETYIEIDPTEIEGNPFKLIDEQWFLLTAGNKNAFNTMTASWGGMGILWNKPVVFVFVRPHRFTFRFMESAPGFTLSFLEESKRDILNFCGKYSGKDLDKVEATGLHVAETEEGSVYFTEARMVIQCNKLYFNDVDPSHFLDQQINRNYPKKDYHRMYIGEIVKCLVKK